MAHLSPRLLPDIITIDKDIINSYVSLYYCYIQEYYQCRYYLMSLLQTGKLPVDILPDVITVKNLWFSTQNHPKIMRICIFGRKMVIFVSSNLSLGAFWFFNLIDYFSIWFLQRIDKSIIFSVWFFFPKSTNQLFINSIFSKNLLINYFFSLIFFKNSLINFFWFDFFQKLTNQLWIFNLIFPQKLLRNNFSVIFFSKSPY